MLVSLADAKAFLGEVGTTYDTFLTQQLQMLSDAVEGYCGRIFSEDDYVQTWYREDYENMNELTAFHFPVSAIASVKVGDGTTWTTLDESEYRLHKPTGSIKRNYGHQLNDCQEQVQIEYTAGYATVPTPITNVILCLIQESYNRKKAGVALNFGKDVQSVSIPGTISVQFDYTLDANSRSNTFGSVLGSYVNSLDIYRSERTIAGSGRVEYVEEGA